MNHTHVRELSNELMLNHVFSMRQRLDLRNSLLCREYARKSAISAVKKPRTSKRNRDDSGKNVMAEYESYLSGHASTSSSLVEQQDGHEVAERDETHGERGVTEHYELPKQIVLDQRDLERQMSKHLQGAFLIMLDDLVCFVSRLFLCIVIVSI
jgi:hypothetical protein